MILLPISIILIYFSKNIILLLLGEKFMPAAVPLSLLSAYFFINGIRKPVASILAGTDRMGLLVKISIISVITNLILNFILIPKELLGIQLIGLGMNGAALATLCSGIVYTSLCKFYTSKVTGIKTDPQIIKLYFAGFIMISIFFMVQLLLPLPLNNKFTTLVFLTLVCLIGLIIYIAILFLFKEFTGKEIKLLKESLNPRKMKDYINKEMKE
jgi:O-antigen/teichoic acid export membrane protein